MPCLLCLCRIKACVTTCGAPFSFAGYRSVATNGKWVVCACEDFIVRGWLIDKEVSVDERAKYKDNPVELVRPPDDAASPKLPL